MVLSGILFGAQAAHSVVAVWAGSWDCYVSWAKSEIWERRGARGRGRGPGQGARIPYQPGEPTETPDRALPAERDRRVALPPAPAAALAAGIWCAAVVHETPQSKLLCAAVRNPQHCESSSGDGRSARGCHSTGTAESDVSGPVADF